MDTTVPAIYRAIDAVRAELCETGIAKKRRNSDQGYDFRGIDDMYNVLAPLLAKHHIVIVPRYTAREVAEREARRGGTLFYVTVTGDFTFVSVEDGSSFVAGPFFGEAMDSSDKATNKAMSAAMKYALMETFTIPTKGDNDTESQSPEVVANKLPSASDRKTLAALQTTAKGGMKELAKAWKALPDDVRKRLTAAGVMGEVRAVAESAVAPEPEEEAA